MECDRFCCRFLSQIWTLYRKAQKTCSAVAWHTHTCLQAMLECCRDWLTLVEFRVVRTLAKESATSEGRLLAVRSRSLRVENVCSISGSAFSIAGFDWTWWGANCHVSIDNGCSAVNNLNWSDTNIITTGYMSSMRSIKYSRFTVVGDECVLESKSKNHTRLQGKSSPCIRSQRPEIKMRSCVM